MSSMLPVGDPKSTVSRRNIAETCGKCHGNKTVMQGSGISNRPFLSYQESVHAQAVAQGNVQAAVCTDCHGGHDIRPASDAQSLISKLNIPKTCGQCHASRNNAVPGQRSRQSCTAWCFTFTSLYGLSWHTRNQAPNRSGHCNRDYGGCY